MHKSRLYGCTLGGSLALLFTFGLAARAEAQAVLATRGTSILRVGPEGTREIDVGCTAVQALIAGDRAYAACGADGVVSVRLDGSREITQRLELGGPVSALLLASDVVWARLGDGRMTRIDAAAPVPEELTVPTPPAALGTEAPQAAEQALPRRPRGEPEAPPPPIGRVTRVEGGHALVTLDDTEEVDIGSTVEFLRRPTNVTLQLENERDDLVSVGRGVVEATSGHTARVRVEVDATVRAEMWVRPAPPSDLLLLPPEPVGMATLSVRLRPFIPMGILGFGAINDVSIGYTTDFGLAIRLEATGFAFGFARKVYRDAESMPFMPVVHGYAGAVTRWFELGVGLGWSRSYRVLAAPGEQDNEGFSVLTMLRLGTEDGLSLRLRFTLLVREVWEVGDFYADGRVPITHGVWFIGGGGGGNTGVRYGEAGVRFLVMGNGLGGSVFLHATIGVGMIEQGPNFSNAGPMLGLGIDARL